MRISDVLNRATSRLVIVGLAGLLVGMFLGTPFVAAQRPGQIKAEIECLPSLTDAWGTSAAILGNTLTQRARTGWQIVAVTSFQRPQTGVPCIMFITRRT